MQRGSVIGGKTLRRLAVASFLLFLQVTEVSALVATAAPFDTPVPEGWRAPLARFLSDLGLSDTASTVEASKAVRYQTRTGGPEMMIFRVLHKETCKPDQDECLTLIAHLEKDELVSDAMFYAGDKINYGDVLREFLGAQSVTIFFWGRHQVVGVRVTAKGLLVSSSPTEQSK